LTESKSLLSAAETGSTPASPDGGTGGQPKGGGVPAKKSWFKSPVLFVLIFFVVVIVGGTVAYLVSVSTVSQLNSITRPTTQTKAWTQRSELPLDQYLITLMGMMRQMQDILFDFSSVIRQVMNGRITYTEAADKVADIRIRANSIYIMASALNPPARFGQCHQYFLAATNNWLKAFDYVEKGLRQRSPSLIEQAYTYQDLGNEYINKIGSCLQSQS